MRATMRLAGLLTVVALTSIFLSSQTQSTSTDESKPPAPAKVGNGVSAPKLLKHPEPEYSAKAREAKYEGVCVLWLVVGTDGIPRDIRVARSIGMGLDEKAIEAIKRWTFQPALKNGQPVAVQINVEVSFRLGALPNNDPRIDRLIADANSGDAKAEFELAQKYFEGQDVSKDTMRGTQFLLKSADQNYPKAEFLMGDLYASGSRPGDCIEAYVWYSLAQRNGEKISNQLKDLESKMTTEQLAAARARIDAWKPTAAK